MIIVVVSKFLRPNLKEKGYKKNVDKKSIKLNSSIIIYYLIIISSEVHTSNFNENKLILRNDSKVL